MQKGIHKLIFYTGYEGMDSFELFNVVDDPEETKDLFATEGMLAKSLADELLDALNAANVAARNL
jgi:hypothetical protein